MKLATILLIALSLSTLAACGAKRDVQLTFAELKPASTGETLPEYLDKVLFTDDPVSETEGVIFYDAYSALEDKVDFIGRVSDAMEAWTSANKLSMGNVELVQVNGVGYKANPAKLHAALLKPISSLGSQKEFIAQPAFFYTWIDSTGTNPEQWRNGMKGAQHLVLAQGVSTNKVPRGYKLKEGVHWNVFILQGKMLQAALKNAAQVHAQTQQNAK